jgi:hypothetical protein
MVIIQQTNVYRKKISKTSRENWNSFSNEIRLKVLEEIEIKREENQMLSLLKYQTKVNKSCLTIAFGDLAALSVNTGSCHDFSLV